MQPETEGPVEDTGKDRTLKNNRFSSITFIHVFCEVQFRRSCNEWYSMQKRHFFRNLRVWGCGHFYSPREIIRRESTLGSRSTLYNSSSLTASARTPSPSRSLYHAGVEAPQCEGTVGSTGWALVRTIHVGYWRGVTACWRVWQRRSY